MVVSTQVRDTVASAVENAVFDRFGSLVDRVETEMTETPYGDLKIVITIHIIVEGANKSTVGSKFVGLTSRLREAMGADFRDVFPVILPVAAHAHA